MKKFMLAMIFFLASPVIAFSEPLTLREVSEAACRIAIQSENGSMSYGSGTVVKEVGQQYFVLTNAHVAKQLNNVATVDFFRYGKLASRVNGTVIWMYYQPDSSIDLAILSINKDQLAIKPRVIPIAARSSKLSAGQYIYGSGFPQGDWLHSWEANINTIDNSVVRFNMPPIGGQSGSGILANIKDADGESYTKLVGVLAWRIDNSYGGGISLDRIYQVLSRTAERDYIKIDDGYAPISHEDDSGVICNNCGKPKRDHYHRYNKDGSFEMKNGIPWLYCPGTHTEAQCPNGRCFPFAPRPPARVPPRVPFNPNPTPPGGNNSPYIPPIFGPDEPPVEEKPPVDNAKIKELEDLIAKLKATNADYEGQVKVLENQVAQLKNENGSLVNENGEIIETIQVLEEEKQSLLSRLAEKAKEAANGFTLPFISNFGPTGNVIATLIAAFSTGGLGALLWHNVGMPFVVKRFGWLPAKIIGAIVKRKLNLKSKEQLEQDLGLSQKKNEKPLENEYNNIEPPPIFTEVSFEKDKAHPYVLELFAQAGGKIKGYTPKEWAIKKALYEKAVALLKDGALEYNGKSVQNYEQAAYAIEEYVRDKFYNKIDIRKYNVYDAIENDSYVGYLYFQAVEKLKIGTLETLSIDNGGHYEAASAVEQWVKDKTYRLFRGQ